ncbi:hypothetical protein [Bartonella sp. B30(2025)]
MIEKVFSFIMVAILLSTKSVLASECVEVGRDVAAKQSGVLVRSTPTVQNGRDMCVVVVVVPAHDDKKLRRVEISVPAY